MADALNRTMTNKWNIMQYLTSETLTLFKREVYMDNCIGSLTSPCIQV
jgi:hypothetical protein